MELRDYQQQAITDINEGFKSSNKLAYQLATGGGKTFIFSYLATQQKGKVLILVNRQELVSQTIKSIEELGGQVGGLKDNKQITIGMVETINNRLKKGTYSLKDISLLIVDECHRLEYVKVINQAPENCKVLGFTATPTTDKVLYFYKCKICNISKDNEFTCCNEKKATKWRKKVALADYYENLIQGLSVSDLISRNMLVQEKNYSIKSLDLDKLKEDSSGQFSGTSEKKVFNQKASYKSVLDNYLQIAKGSKTMIFNSNIEANKEIYELFKAEGINVRMYDSKSGGNRQELVNWFKSEPDAVLLNVGVFTTGFDCKEVETIILNRATNSLALYIQMVGRGGRITDKIYKPSFKFIDMGGNIQRFNTWSSDRDWSKLFNDRSEKKCIIDDTLKYWECKKCGYFNLINLDHCFECAEPRHKPTSRKGYLNEIAQPLEEVKLPDVNRLVEFCKVNNFDIAFCRREYYKSIAEMFILKGTSKEAFLKAKNTGRLNSKIRNFAIDDYFTIQASGLNGNIVRSLENFIENIIRNIEKVYFN